MAMTPRQASDAETPPRPLLASYWVEPGRLLVGEHPATQSRADSMDRLRRLLAAGVTCFVDLTEPGELPSYEAMLPFSTPGGRRIEYLRDSIPDHGVPSGPDAMARVLAAIDAALADGHVVYLHCRAGIGRSATVAACWLAGRPETSGDPLDRLQACWQQSSRSRHWPAVPETEEQEEFVREWIRDHAPSAASVSTSPSPAAGPRTPEARLRGSLLGLAVGDALGESRAHDRPAELEWTQHTSLALCLAESLLELGRFDARDQIDRYLRWQRDGHLTARGVPGRASADVAKALAVYQWRGLPMAGSHDPRDHSPASLPRVVAAVAYAAGVPAEAVPLAAECSRTTHQSPIVLDACRYFAGLLCGALHGASPEAVLTKLYEPAPGAWAARPLRPELVRALGGTATGAPRYLQGTHGREAGEGDVVRTLLNARDAVAAASGVEDAIRRSIASGHDPALDGALAGALAGAFQGDAALPAWAVTCLRRAELVESFAARLASRAPGAVA
jgi:ADP-ribosyl-[dinitrogen reductase] hydrolase